MGRKVFVEKCLLGRIVFEGEMSVIVFFTKKLFGEKFLGRIVFWGKLSLGRKVSRGEMSWGEMSWVEMS